MTHNRRSIRLPHYDYRGQGAYFVTICSYQREELFGAVKDGDVLLNSFGEFLPKVWARCVDDGHQPEPYDFVVMPNHVHGIIWLSGSTVGARRPPVRDLFPPTQCLSGQKRRSAKMDASPLQHTDSAKAHEFAAQSLAARIAAFKSMSTKAINRVRITPGAPV
jgi:hypothetical protein